MLSKTATLALGAAALLAAGCAQTMNEPAAPVAPAPVVASDNPMVGGAPMFANRNIIENAVESADHTTLVAAVKAAGLVDTLSGPGPFTVFAPTNAAFAALPAGTVDSLLLPENKDRLTQILTYHVVPGRVMSSDAAAMIAADGGAHVVNTVAGNTFVIRDTVGGGIAIGDQQGNLANVTIADVAQSNGVIHVIDQVLLPAN